MVVDHIVSFPHLVVRFHLVPSFLSFTRSRSTIPFISLGHKFLVVNIHDIYQLSWALCTDTSASTFSLLVPARTRRQARPHLWSIDQKKYTENVR